MFTSINNFCSLLQGFPQYCSRISTEYRPDISRADGGYSFDSEIVLLGRHNLPLAYGSGPSATGGTDSVKRVPIFSTLPRTGLVQYVMDPGCRKNRHHVHVRP